MPNYPIFCQSATWEKCNNLLGHKSYFVDLSGVQTLIIIKNARRGRYMEIPGGPNIDWTSEKTVKSALGTLKTLAKKEKCVFIRIRPQILDTEENRTIFKNAGLRPSPMHLSAEHTVILDLEKPEEALLSEMRRQTRYEVRRSAKLGLSVSYDNSIELFKEFHKVQSETAKRQNFIPPDEKTLLAEREAFGDNARIYVAKTSSGEPVAYGLILIDDDNATYYEAASTDLNRNLPGAYALQWQVIRDMKSLGIKYYNLWGIAPPGVKNHRYSGVTTFKTGFGGEVVSFIPAHDLIVGKIGYSKDYIIESIRKKRRKL